MARSGRVWRGRARQARSAVARPGLAGFGKAGKDRRMKTEAEIRKYLKATEAMQELNTPPVGSEISFEDSLILAYMRGTVDAFKTVLNIDDEAV
jgi:hypothetical protein